MSVNVQVSGIVLQTYDQGEGDLVVVLLTPENGKVPLKVKGAKKPGAKVAPHLQMLSHVSVTAVAPVWGNLPIVVGAEPLNGFKLNQSQLPGALAAIGIVEAFVSEGVPAPRTYLGLLDFLRNMNGPEARLERLILTTLTESGHAPCVRHCVLCAKAMGSASATFSVIQGGLLCANCRRADYEAMPVSPAVVVLLQNLGDNRGSKEIGGAGEPAALNSVKLILSQFVQYVSPRPIYAFEFLNLFH